MPDATGRTPARVRELSERQKRDLERADFGFRGDADESFEDDSSARALTGRTADLAAGALLGAAVGAGVGLLAWRALQPEEPRYMQVARGVRRDVERGVRDVRRAAGFGRPAGLAGVAEVAARALSGGRRRPTGTLGRLADLAAGIGEAMELVAGLRDRAEASLAREAREVRRGARGVRRDVERGMERGVREVRRSAERLTRRGGLRRG